ncbi:MAG TPA: hypothetical protein VND40_04840 [Nitrososphaerales archaeon]|nr:hypothetical protein [Nitrososphaerales archaeon]
MGSDQSPSDAQPGRDESRVFVMKAARSVAELQPKVNNVADVMVFLEVLGYTRGDALQNGFDDLNGVAREVYEFLDMLQTDEGVPASSRESYVEVPTTATRIAEGLALSFGWIGALVLLFVAGVSLWLSLVLPLTVVTVFMGGLFAGLFITAGPLSGFNRLFTFYHDQGNLAEAKRVLKRTYLEVGAVLAAASGGLYAVALLTGFPTGLFEIGIATLIVSSTFMMVYAIIYSLKKYVHLVLSYSLAFAALIAVYFGTGALIPQDTSRYFLALASAVAILCAFGLYDQFEVLSGRSFRIGADAPAFFRPITINKSTVRSRFSVQFWETLPSYLFGTSFFLLIFGDRILSWFFNPGKVADGVTLPFVFNSVYHAGADAALFIIFPALIIQYVMMTPIFAQVSNATLEYSVSEVQGVQRFLVKRYERIMATSVLASVAVAVGLDYLYPMVMSGTAFALTPTSLQILHIASVANVLLVVFFANSLFIQFMNRMTGLAMIATMGALLVTIGGLMLATTGFQNLEVAYLGAAVAVACLSTVYVLKNLSRAASIFFARYM